MVLGLFGTWATWATRTSKTEGRGFESQPGQVDFSLCLSGMVRHSEKHLIIILHPSSLSYNNHLKVLNEVF